MSVYEPQDYEKVIERIKTKISQLNIEMGKCLTEEEIMSFESRHNVKLPQAYRMFLKYIGNGCKRMLDGCRLNDLECCPQQELSKPFLLEKFWLWEDDERDGDVIEADMQNKVYRGNIELINLGCGNSYNLIITGNHQGEVWNFTDVGVQPCCEPQDFLWWFELWLDNQDTTDYFKDFVYDETDYD